MREVKRNGIKEIDKVCALVLNLKESDFEQARAMAQGQSNYINPLKPATTAKQGALGDYNARVLNALHALREVIKAG